MTMLQNGDCIDEMRDLADGCVDMVLTSPPYDDMRKYEGSADDWNFEKFKSTATELMRVLKDGGVMVWVVADATKDGSETGSSFMQALYFKQIGFNINDTMIWQKKNPMPQVRQPRYTQSFEYMFVLSKGRPKTFNPIKVECKCSGRIYDSTCRNMGGESGRTKKNFIINKQKNDLNIWRIAVSQNKTGHPAVFPVELADRHIRSWSNPCDIVLDPFMGSGTTGVAAVRLSRHFIGIERNPHYYKIAIDRIGNTKTELARPIQQDIFSQTEGETKCS